MEKGNYLQLLSNAIDKLNEETINKWFLEHEYQIKKGVQMTLANLKPVMLKAYEEACERYGKNIEETPQYSLKATSFFCNNTFSVNFDFRTITKSKSVSVKFLPLDKSE